MGNLDFLEKKPRIAYTLSWDGVTEGKVTTTGASMGTAYKISDNEFIPTKQPIVANTKLTSPSNIKAADGVTIGSSEYDNLNTYIAFNVKNSDDSSLVGK